MLLTHAALLSSLIAAPLQTAPTTTDLAGQWSVVVDRSDFGQMTVPVKMVRTITVHGSDLEMVTVTTTDAGVSKIDVIVSTDSTSRQNAVNGLRVVASGKWSGDTFVVTLISSSAEAAMQIEDRLTLSSDRLTLTDVRSVVAGDTKTAARLLMVKSR
jgi:hypothetical protein